jgi:hypothetical protein
MRKDEMKLVVEKGMCTHPNSPTGDSLHNPRDLWNFITKE